MRQGNIRNRTLKAKGRIYIQSEDSWLEIIGQELEVVQNLDRSVRNETMYNVMDRVVAEAKRILKQSKEESRAFSDVNQRSKNLEDRIDFAWTETDTVSIVIPEDIVYAGITDLKEYVISAETAKLRFYWHRYGVFQVRDQVVRPGNQFLTLAIKRYASETDIVTEINKQIDFYAQKYDNITDKGGNLGKRKSRSTRRKGNYTSRNKRRGVGGYNMVSNEE
jgi:hypothetical protein